MVSQPRTALNKVRIDERQMSTEQLRKLFYRINIGDVLGFTTDHYCLYAGYEVFTQKRSPESQFPRHIIAENSGGATYRFTDTGERIKIYHISPTDGQPVSTGEVQHIEILEYADHPLH